MKKLLIPIVVVIILIGSWVLYQKSLIQSTYNGLPTVPCLDPTKSIKQSFSFHLSIYINGKNFPLSSSIGHDYGNCLHDIFVKDTSGVVYVMTNNNEKFNLGNFFDVWHATYNKNQLFGYQTGGGHEIKVFVNGKEVETYDKTPITPNAKIEIDYK